TAQRGECRGNFTTATSFTLVFRFVSDTPLEADATITLTSDQDGEPGNNQARAKLTVRPFIDVAIASPAPSVRFIIGAATSVNYRVTTGARPVPGVTLNVGFGQGYEFVSVNGGAVTCQMVNSQPQCPLGDLPGNANLPITIEFRGVNNGSGSQ